MQAVAQTILMMMLKNAKQVHISLQYSEKKIFSFVAAFTIDGNGEFILFSDLCKPRLMKNINEVESIISRSCEELTDLTFSIVAGSRYIKYIQKSRLAERLQRVQVMADEAQLMRDAIQEEINVTQQTWDEGNRKQARLLELQKRYECAEGIINTRNGYLPNGVVVIFPQSGGGF